MTDIFLEPINNLVIQLLKFAGLSLLAGFGMYVIVNSITSSEELSKFLGFLAFGFAFCFVLLNIFLPGLQAL